MSMSSQWCTAWAASRTRGGLTLSSRSATVASGPSPAPTIWRITPSPPLRVTTPAVGASSPVMMRSSVVLPAPLAPTRATFAPSPTRNDTSSSSTRPSGRSKRTPATSTCPTSDDCARPAVPAAPGYASDGLAHRLQDPAYDGLVGVRDVHDQVTPGDVPRPTAVRQALGDRGRVHAGPGGGVEGRGRQEPQPGIRGARVQPCRSPSLPRRLAAAHVEPTP